MREIFHLSSFWPKIRLSARSQGFVFVFHDRKKHCYEACLLENVSRWAYPTCSSRFCVKKHDLGQFNQGHLTKHSVSLGGLVLTSRLARPASVRAFERMSTFQVVYVTATLPYILLFVLLIRGATLEGAGQGIVYLLRPNFTKLAESQVSGGGV